MKKSGKICLFLASVSAGYLLYCIVHKQKQIKILDSEYANYLIRLKEFFLDDYNESAKKFARYIQLGLPADVAFQTVVELNVKEDLFSGDF